jgi:hypothetical protein
MQSGCNTNFLRRGSGGSACVCTHQGTPQGVWPPVSYCQCSLFCCLTKPVSMLSLFFRDTGGWPLQHACATPAHCYWEDCMRLQLHTSTWGGVHDHRPSVSHAAGLNANPMTHLMHWIHCDEHHPCSVPHPPTWSSSPRDVKPVKKPSESDSLLPRNGKRSFMACMQRFNRKYCPHLCNRCTTTSEGSGSSLCQPLRTQTL